MWEIIRFHRLVSTTEKALLVEYQDGSQRWIPRSICKKVIRASSGSVQMHVLQHLYNELKTQAVENFPCPYCGTTEPCQCAEDVMITFPIAKSYVADWTVEEAKRENPSQQKLSTWFEANKKHMRSKARKSLFN